jgi:hypothetical protein
MKNLKTDTLREERFAETWKKACVAGQAAGDAAVPAPVAWISVGLDDKPLPGAKPSYVSEGLCGGAYIRVRPATSRFVRWLKKNGIGSKGVYGGWEFSVPYDYRGQSAERYAAQTNAACEVLRQELGGEGVKFLVREYLT